MNDLLHIQGKLSQLKPELVSRYHISAIGLFGSIVRNDFTAESDIDIVVEFSEPIGVAFIDLANELAQKLNRKVDLVSKKGIKPAYLNAIASQIIYV